MLTANRHQTACSRLISSIFLVVLTVSLPIGLMAADKTLTADQLFAPEHVVDVKITLAEKDWDTLRRQTRAFSLSLGKTPLESPFEYVKADVSIDGVTIKNVGIRKKGFLGSLSDTRPSLKIKFDEYQQQDPIQGLNRLTLNNNQQDRSLASQYLGYRFFNDSGSVACRCNHAKVTVNGRYLGIYSHVESVKSPFLMARYGNDGGHFYEGTLADLFDGNLQRFELKTKKTTLQPLQQVATLLAQDSLDLAALEKLLDVPAFVKFWATESLLGFWDGYTNNQNNFFIYQNPANSKLYFMPWGLDSAFVSMMPLPPFFIRVKSVHCQSMLANRLYRDPAIQQLYRKTLITLLDKHWDEEKLIEELDSMETRLKDHLHRSQRDFSGKLNATRKFIRERRAIMEKELDRWPVNLSRGPRSPIYFKELGKATVTFSTRWNNEKPENPYDNGTVELHFSLNGETVTFKDDNIGIYATLNKRGRRGGDSPTIVMVGNRASNSKQLILSVGLPASNFHPATKKTIVQGYCIEGSADGIRAIFGGSKRQSLAGFAQFDQASMKPGAPVSGKLELQVLQMTGGKHQPVPK